MAAAKGKPEASEAEMQALRVARERLQAELPFLQRREAVAERLHKLADTFAAVAPRLRPGGHRVFWQACTALAEALEGGGLPPNEEAIGVLRDMDGELRSGTALDRGFYRRAPDEWLYRRLLGLLARSRPVSPLLVKIQTLIAWCPMPAVQPGPRYALTSAPPMPSSRCWMRV